MRYRKISVQIWNDEKFRRLSDMAQLAFIYVLTHPQMTGIGAMRATIDGLAAERKKPVKAFREAFGEAFREGLLLMDESADYLCVPNFLRHNAPESPNVVVSWKNIPELLPECDLQREHFQDVKAFAEGLGEGFAKALPEAFREGYPKPSPNQGARNKEQGTNNKEQEAAQQKKKDQTDRIATLKESWNNMASTCGLSCVIDIANQRLSHAKVRVSDEKWWNLWFAAMSKIPDSPFLRGSVDGKTWKADFDWFIKPDSCTKILEGKYDSKPEPVTEETPIQRQIREWREDQARIDAQLAQEQEQANV